MGSIKKIKMRNSIYDLEDTRLEIGSVTTTPSFKGKPGVGFTTNSTPYAFLLRDFTSEVFGNNTQVIEWSHTHNMNDYKDAGTYRIKGERTGNPLDDNLPIMNQGSGHTIEGILYVLDSSLTNGSGNIDDCTITQFLILSNRVGGQEGDMYMRSAYGSNKDSLIWKPWEKYQTNMEVGCVSDYYSINTLTTSGLTVLDHNGGMTTFIDNGIYSGVYIPPKAILGTPEDIGDTVQPNPSGIETFVMVVINNYAFAGDDKKTITQIKFAVTLGGVFSMEKRRSFIESNIRQWSQWESIGSGSNIIEWTDGDNVTKVVADRYGAIITMGSGTDYYSTTLGVLRNNGLIIGNDYKSRLLMDGADGYINLESNDSKLTVKGYGELNLGSSTLYIETDDESLLPDDHVVILGKNTKIGNNVTIGNKVKIKSPYSSKTLWLGDVDTSEVQDDDYFIGGSLGKNSIIGNNIKITSNGVRILFEYNGKTAELPLTEPSAS